jgi:hypothetical protein
MSRASADTLLELHAAAQFYLRKRTQCDATERERLKAALRQLFKDRGAQIPPDLAASAGEAFTILREAVERCRKFGVAWDQVAAAVNNEWEPRSHG